MNVRSLIRLVSVAALVVPWGLAALPTDAGACLNSTIRESDAKVMLLASAEASVARGRFTEAADSVLASFPYLKIDRSSDPLLGRAQRIVALALIRTEGLLSAGEVFHASTADERRTNLEWAIATLRRLEDAKKNTPALESDLGEALSKLPETQGEALAILDKLARKDLLPSAQGWAALAKLRRAAGDQAGHEAALKRAEAMANAAKEAPAAPSIPAVAPVPKARSLRGVAGSS